MWTQVEAIALCTKLEQVAPEYGCHVALTGGTLYKEGPRKDCDILFYKIRQSPSINMLDLFSRIETLGVTIVKQSGWVTKAVYEGKGLDLFFPECFGDDEYPTEILCVTSSPFVTETFSSTK